MRVQFSIARLSAAALLSVAWLCNPAWAAPVLPTFADATFTGSAPDNPYFPMTNSAPSLFSGSFLDEDGELATESFELTNTGPGRVLLGVQTFTQQDLAFEDGLLVEATSDYYAQDTDGNVWYFGEDVVNYVYDDDDQLIETNNSSSWLAGENGAEPGYIMPVDLSVGFEYFQESAPNDDAIDQAMIWAVNQTVVLDIGTFNNVLQILETNPLEPDSREFKYYAPGVGLILVEEDLDEDFANPELSVALQASAVPEPDTLPLLGLGVLCAYWTRRHAKRC